VVNQSGAYAGVANSSVDNATGNITLGSRFISSLNGAASAPPATLTGTWFTGGTATTTKPQLLLEPAGTTSTAWSTAGTGLGINATSGFTGQLLDAQVNGTSFFNVSGAGATTGASFIPTGSTIPANGVYLPGANRLGIATNSVARLEVDASGRLLVGTTASTASNGQTAPLQIAGSVRATQGLASTIDLGSIALDATAAVTLPKSGLYMINVTLMNLSALFFATITGGSVGVRLMFSTDSDVVAGLTTEPAGGTYLRLWVSSGQLQVKNVNSFEGPYFITSIAT
jgi:hypothetical protein